MLLGICLPALYDLTQPGRDLPGSLVGRVLVEQSGRLLALGVIGTGVAYVINYRIITDDGPVLASTVTYLLPVVAAILGALVLTEPITIQLAAGVAVVLAGVALTRRNRETAQPDHQARTAESGST